jgi:hypothetical protein
MVALLKMSKLSKRRLFQTALDIATACPVFATDWSLIRESSHAWAHPGEDWPFPRRVDNRNAYI